MIGRELSVVEMDELFKNIQGYERSGDTCSLFFKSMSIHWHVKGWTWIMYDEKCSSILSGNMSIKVGHLSLSVMVNHIPGLQNPECE